MIIDRIDQIDELAFDEAGLIPVIAQDARTGEVLMLAWANRTALEATLRDGTMWYWSRSRREPWHKGRTSGNSQTLVSLHADCDRDTLVALVEPAGPACHTGDRTCFLAAPVLIDLEGTIDTRKRSPADGYTDRLLADRNLRHKKLGEETVELVTACMEGERSRTAAEAADLIYHVMVACAANDVSITDVLQVLHERRAPRTESE